MHSSSTRKSQLVAISILLTLALAPAVHSSSQVNNAAEKNSATAVETPLSGLHLRGIGPALMSGRIADVNIDPTDRSTWYVAVGSGGVWKTTNAGTTWTPLFDEQPSYSIGCITLDPTNSNTVWVGTGENVGGRHVGFGDGVYRSRDGGNSWEQVGLADSQHISKIVFDPRDPKIVFVASQGPLWSPGGERGLFRSADDGATWTQVLGGSEWTGVTDVVIDSQRPDILYAATWQRQRSVAALMDGGPESAIHKSTDGGLTWRRLVKGLPEEDCGKIGLAISPQDPDVVYAAIELANRTGGIWRSGDRGESWKKRSDAVSGATGPHYYQELVASPHVFDTIYLMDVRIQVSDDGGTTFRHMSEKDKHSDNHALAFLSDDPEYLLAGTDGGLYESFDLGATWRFIANLPVTQFYKVALDDREPFYSVYGGTQDNSTQGGPSRTDTMNGIRNQDWFITLFADGHQPAVEPGNPDIVYSEWQQGNLVRHDRRTGEIVYIQPQPEPGEPAERFNWDAPILISPHSPTRLFYASHRVWRSEDRGDSWVPISPDLTRNEDRLLMPLMGRVWSYDSAWDLDAMSEFNTVTSLAESPVVQGLLYAGTDDGLIQVSENAGTSWRSVEVGSLPGVADRAFVNDIKADLFDSDTVYAALDDHKNGHFEPILMKSEDRGMSWTSIAGDLPPRHLVWRIVQDHVSPDLLFAGTEFGVFVTLDGGQKWHELSGGVPTIPFRDLAIQKRENDLVGATFGRGFYILDDYSCLREIDDDTLEKEAHLFSVRDPWWYVPRRPLGGRDRADQGASYFVAPNPPFGAVFTYHLSEDLKSREQRRREREKKVGKEGGDTPYPGWEEIELERRQEAPQIVLIVRDHEGNVVRWLHGPTSKGFHRVAWDLRFPSAAARGEADGNEPYMRMTSPDSGWLTPPGRYSVTLAKRIDGVLTELSPAVTFTSTPLREGTLKGMAPTETAAFTAEVAQLERAVTAASMAIELTFKRLDLFKKAVDRSTAAPNDLDSETRALERRLYILEEALRGNRSMAMMGETIPHSILRRLRVIQSGNQFSTYGPTPTHIRSLEIARSEFSALRSDLDHLISIDLAALEQRAEATGVPWTPGRPLPEAPQ